MVITEDVMKAAVGNRASGEYVIKLLLERRGAEVVISEDVVKAAAGNVWSGIEIMGLVLEQRRAEVMKSAATGHKAVVKKLLRLGVDPKAIDENQDTHLPTAESSSKLKLKDGD